MTRAATKDSGAARPSSQLPEPGRFWIRFAPRVWDPPEHPWVDLAGGRLGEWARNRASSSADLLQLSETPLDDVLYLPPVVARRAAARDDLAGARLMGGTPVLVQLFPGEESKVPAVTGAAFVYDLLPALLGRDLGRLRKVPAGAAVVWPLIAGLTDDPALWELGCRSLAADGVRWAQALTPVLSPADRRRLAEGWGEDEAFDALFHRTPASEREFARVAHRHGLAPFLPRPLPRPPVRGIGNREIAGWIALAAELWLRLGRPVEQGQSLYRAARWIDGTPYDLEALAREGNLGVLSPLDELSRRLVAEAAESGEPALLAELLAEYVSPEDGSGGEGISEGSR